MASLFGKKPKMPATEVMQEQPAKVVQGSDVEAEQLQKKLAKRRKATLLSQQQMGEARTTRPALGTAVR